MASWKNERLTPVDGLVKVNAPIPDKFSYDPTAVVRDAVGGDVHVNVHDPTDDTSAQSSVTISNEVTDRILEALGCTNPHLALLCSVVARAAIAEVATSAGMTVYYGDRRNPLATMNADFRPPDPVEWQAQVTNTLQPGEQ